MADQGHVGAERPPGMPNIATVITTLRMPAPSPHRSFIAILEDVVDSNGTLLSIADGPICHADDHMLRSSTHQSFGSVSQEIIAVNGTLLIAGDIEQQEDIHSLDDALTQVHGRLRQLEQRPVAAPDASSSNTSDRLEALEIDVGSLKDGVQLQQTATQQLEQRICTAANHLSSEPCETAPKFDGQEIFCESTKTDPISWFRKFELTLQLHYVKEHKHHRKANPTAIKLADGRTQQLIDRYIEAVPVYLAPHACEPVTFDILDTDFDIILGMPWFASADHTVYFHRRTLTIRDAFGVEVSCNIPLPHPSIRCQMVTAKTFRATCAYKQPDEIGLCFLRTVAVADSSPTALSSDPRVVRLLDEFADIFESLNGVVPDRPISHEIILEAGVVPLKGCIYCMSEEELTVLRPQLDDLLDKGWIRPSGSPYGASVLFVRKKNKDLRLCIDYRKLNAQTLDLKSGYHQISIRTNDRYKSAFKTRYGHFEWVVMPFGLTKAPATFQAAMTNEFRAMLDRFVLVYLDNILVYRRSLVDHLEHLRRVLETLRRAKYKANRDKCEFVWQELEYLGHFVTPEGISPLSDKIQAIQEWPEPQNVTDVRSFLGLTGYYHRFIKGYSKITAHLAKFQCEDRPFDFGEDARESFSTLKAALLSVEVLRIYNPLLPTLVTTDASDYGIGVVLEQHDGMDWHPIEYFSKKVPVVHSIDDACKKEFLAFVQALKRDVTRYCESCEVCRHCKSRNHRPYGEMRLLPVPLRRTEAIAMDITGPFPKHKTGVDGILTVVDRLTKFAMLLPCRYHAKASELPEVLYAGSIRTKGYPKEIVCDRDTRFMSDFWLALIKRWG
ncbi:hypothetical protein CBR_g41525 [Chara braunii]|uniref:Integrase catalytic domain-containing protein n=1 Tax=Chara braunii TaxID=69332 RepID=A0A388K2P1_CHABU|nr:hypothetical protein CBR_g41525 [Chara braunii]|eukprot:GBG64324.1 hypothetical protein CBR_g41525 [Chara braunii]